MAGELGGHAAFCMLPPGKPLQPRQEKRSASKVNAFVRAIYALHQDKTGCNQESNNSSPPPQDKDSKDDEVVTEEMVENDVSEEDEEEETIGRYNFRRVRTTFYPFK